MELTGIGVDKEMSKFQSGSYQIKPSLEDTFKIVKIKDICSAVLSETLTGKTYSAKDASQWTKHISDEVNFRIKELAMTRYKHVVQVILGQQLGAGCKYIARCRWDADCDNQAQSTFTTSSLFCIVTVFGIYLY